MEDTFENYLPKPDHIEGKFWLEVRFRHDSFASSLYRKERQRLRFDVLLLNEKERTMKVIFRSMRSYPRDEVEAAAQEKLEEIIEAAEDSYRSQEPNP